MTSPLRSGPGIAALLIAVLLLAPRGAGAEAVGSFPNLEPWPGALALGGIPVALGEGVEAVLENPTGMLHGTGRSLAFSHASLFGNGLVRHQSAALLLPRYEERIEWEDGRVVPRRERIGSAMGLGFTNLSGELPGTDTYGEMSIALAYAMRLPLGTLGGLRLRFLQARSTVDGSGGSGYALDAGFEGQRWGLRVGAVARALASDVNWDRSIDGPIPTRLDFGISQEMGRGVTLLAGAGLQPDGSTTRVAGGASWSVPGTPLTLAAGSSWRRTSVEERTDLSAGARLRVGAVAADYGMRTGPAGLGETHRFGLQISFP